MLGAHVVQTPLPGGGFESAFDYARLIESPDQQARRDRIRDAFLSIDPEGLSASERTAWAINTYNFLVIDRVVEELVADPELASIRDVGPRNFAAFDDLRYDVAERRYSLNTFERYFLFRDAGRDAGDAPDDLDPRLHFAIVCAARGCPPLWPEPVHPSRLDEQLDEITRNALGGPRQFRVDDTGAHVSQVFSWYKSDFEPAGGVRRFLVEHAPREHLELLQTETARVEADIEWDWRLNRP